MSPRSNRKPETSPAISGGFKSDILQDNIGRLFRLAYRAFERLALNNLRKMGFESLRMTHLQILPYVPAEGIRTSEIATLANINKQAVGQLAAELEAAGYVKRVRDPKDGRAKLVAFTEKGLELLAAYPHVISGAEGQFEQIIGKKIFGDLKQSARQVNRTLQDIWKDPSVAE